MSDSLLLQVAMRLGDMPGLIALFLDTQFDHFPESWCMQKFKRPYPPANVVFGGQAWERYQVGIRSGRSFVRR